MTAGFDVSVSGLKAAAERVRTVASNIANAESTSSREPVEPASPASPAGGPTDGYAGYRPVRVEQTTTEDGGTRAVTRPVDPPYVRRFDPEHPDADDTGTVKTPNVRLEVELTELMRAQRAYEANLKTISTLDELLGSLVDSKA